MITLFAQENSCSVFFVNGNVLFSQHILHKATIHTQVLFCCLKCPLATTSLFFITVMQKNKIRSFIFNFEMNCWIKKGPYKTDKSHVLSGKTHTFHMNIFLILLIYHLINVFFDFPGAYFRKYTVLMIVT